MDSRSRGISTVDTPSSVGAGGRPAAPVLLDLAGNGLSIDTLSTAAQFVDFNGDGYQHRTAWAGAGTGVLVLDADGDGKISRSSEFVFTEWDQTATGDLEAIKSVFDTNHNGKLDAGDERWTEFKVMVDGQLVSLASLGIASIDLTPTGSGQNFSDGSAITGTTQYTRTDGSTGTVGDAVLVADANGYNIKSTVVADGDGSKTTTLLGYDKEGSLAFHNRITVSADTLTKTTQFDDDGNGTWDRSQTDVTTVTAGVRQRAVSNFNADGSLADKTTTTTSADLKMITTTLDQDGDGIADQTQVFVKNPNGSTSTAISEYSKNGTLLRKVVTSTSVDDLTKTTQVDSTGNGVYDLVRTEIIVVGIDGSRTKTVEDRSSGGTLIGREHTTTGADGRTRTVLYDLDGDSVYETRDVTAITTNVNGISTVTVSTYSASNALIGKSIATTSANGLVKTTSVDLDGDALADVVSSDTTLVGAAGDVHQTVQSKSRNGALLAASTTDISADRKNIAVAVDADGDGKTDLVKTIVADAAGVTTSTVSDLNPDGSLSGKTWQQSTADGLSQTSKVDLNADGVYDVTVTDVTTTDASNNRTRTVTTKSAGGALFGSTATTTSANSLVVTTKDDINGDGIVDRTTVSATVLAADGSRTVTATTTSANGTQLAKIEAKTSADRKTVTTKIDANGDNKVDRTQIETINVDGSRVVTISDTDANGVLHAKSEKTVSANGLTVTDKQDVNGDGLYDVIAQAVTAIAASGSRTTTTSTTSNNGKLLSKEIATVSANGLSLETQIDANGDGTIESKKTDVTVLNTEGSKTRTVSVLAGTGALIEKTILTTGANGLNSTLQVDLDGDGTIDRTTTAATVLNADGSTSETVTVKSGNGALISRQQTMTAAYKNTITVVNDIDGDGSTDEVFATVRNADGSITQTTSTYGAGGVLTSRATRTTSANGLSDTVAVDLNGDGIVDRSTTDVIVFNADGSKTETIIDLNADGSTQDKTTIVTSGNGLSKSITWAAAGTTTSRSMTDATVLNADGSTTQTVAYKKANGSLESQTITTVSADKLTTTITKDINGDGVLDHKILMSTYPDGNFYVALSDLSLSKYIVKRIGPDGLSMDIMPLDNSYGPYYFDNTYWSAIIRPDGGKVETIDQFTFVNNFADDSTLTIETSPDGLSVTKIWTNNVGVVRTRETDVTVLNADGSTTRTINQFDGAVLKSTKVMTSSANGLSTTTGWDAFATGSASQASTDVVTINADGSTTRIVTNTAGVGTLLSKFVTTTSANGRSMSTQEDVDGIVGFDRTKTLTKATLADGTIVETRKTISTNGALLDSSTTSTSANGRLVSISRDVDGNGVADQIEVTTNAVDGSTVTVITDLGATARKIRETKISTSANGLITTTEWDFDGNGTIDQKKVVTETIYGDGSREITSKNTATPSGTLLNTVTTKIGANTPHKVVTTDVDGNGTTDRTESVMVFADGSTTTNTEITAPARKVALLMPGEVYWRKAIAANLITKTSADGLTTTVTADYDDNKTYEYTAVSQTQIDGSIVTTINEKNAGGSIIAKGIATISADGMTTTLKKDGDNNGTYEHIETSVRRIDGSVRLVATDYNASGAITQTITTDVSADGKSTSVFTAKGSTGTGTSTGTGVEFVATGATNDTITGSSGDDYIQAGDGVDTINGGAGNDFIDGGAGADIMKGNAGNDTYIVDDIGDQVVEAANEGTDTVLSSVTYTISDVDVDNLTLTGTAAINATGNSSANVLIGNSANNTLTGNDGNDTLYGGAGNDTLLGGAGNDTLVGEAGNDSLQGAAGDDNYIFRRGDGSDSIDDQTNAVTTVTADINAALALGVFAGGTVNTWVGGYYWQTSTSQLLKRSEAGVDTLTLQGISAADLSFSWTGTANDNLLIGIAGGPAGDSILLNQQRFAGRVEKLALDGVGAMNFAVAPSDGSELQGTSADDILFGLAGVDRIVGGTGNDIIYGGAGNDSLYGQDGNDTIVGGLGNDYMVGAAGNDSYLYRRGDGRDSIFDYSYVTTIATADINAAQALGIYAGGIADTWSNGFFWDTDKNKLYKLVDTGVDTLVLQGGIKAEDLSFSWNSHGDLTIDIAGGTAGDRIVLRQQAMAEARIEKLSLDDLGTRSFAVASSTGAELQGSSADDILFGLARADRIVGGAGNDIIDGGAGDDTLNGQDGDDIIIGGLGNDSMLGGVGNDTYRYRRGDGSDSLFDYSSVATTATADINAALAVGVRAGGIVDTWSNGFYWDSAASKLYKLVGAGVDTLTLEGGIGADDLSFSWTSNGDLAIGFAGTAGDSIVLRQQAMAEARIEKLSLDGLGPINFAVARSSGAMVNGSAEADLLFGLDGNEQINGGAGNDILYGRGGNDILSGGAGNDVYHFGAGDGADTIIESGLYGDNDELDFGAGIDRSELWFSQQGNNLVISVLGTTDSVTVKDWFAGPGNIVETIKSGDGSVLHHSDVATLIAAMASFNPATSATGSGIQPNDPRLGDPAQMGTIAAAMQSSWLAA